MGKPKSAEHRAKLSLAAKARWARMSEQERVDYLAVLRTPAVVSKMAESLRGRTLTAEHLARMSTASAGHEFRGPFVASDETRAKLSKAKRGVPKSEAHRAAISEAHRQRWQEMSEDQRREAWVARLRRNPSSLSDLAVAALIERGISYEPERRFGIYSVDVYVPSLMLAIECDGTYWHSLPKQVTIDSRKDAYLASSWGSRLQAHRSRPTHRRNRCYRPSTQ